MEEFALCLQQGHLFVQLDGELWLLDTGSPTSLGITPAITLAGHPFALETSSFGITAAEISELVGVRCAGLLGVDVLHCFDCIFDLPRGRLVLSSTALNYEGDSVAGEKFLGIPIVTARVASQPFRMVFDTGAQISYFQDDSLFLFPPAGRAVDFYPTLGRFETDTYLVPLSLGGSFFTLRCGRLPEPLAGTLAMASAQGVIGNEILAGRTVAYFPRRRLLIF